MEHSVNLAQATSADFMAGGGEMGALVRAKDWAATPLGDVRHWPGALRTAVSICLSSRFPMVLWWGSELAMLYNDAWRPVLGQTKHPRALGSPGREIWPEIWDVIGEQLRGVLERGEASWSEDLLLVLERNGFAEEAYFTYSYSPIKDGEGRIGGVFSAVSETTERVISERRLAVLKELAERAAAVRTVEEACTGVAEVLGNADADVAFCALYLAGADQDRGLRLRAQAGLAAPTSVHPDGEDSWRLFEVVAGQPVLLEDLAERFGSMPGGRWPEACTRALVLPLMKAARQTAAGVLVLGLSPRLAFDSGYRRFAEMIAAQTATAVANARAYEEERARTETLAELDRAKTAFFSNVSHEFRTPLTLMLGPLEETLSAMAGRPAQELEPLRMVQRNGLRLLKLVNNLLDFSRIEAGRVQARYRPTDLATFTAELASLFRSAVERAGLRLIVECTPLPEPVWVDCDMWEKIVLNLLSNAFKYTFEGEIAVALSAAEGRAQLSVRDSGIGIVQEELPHLFERFHRVEGARGRTHEGSGIGLALVAELARLHGGAVEVESTPGAGSTFTVAVAMGTAHLNPALLDAGEAVPNALAAIAYVEEARRWLPLHGQPAPDVAEEIVRPVGAEAGRPRGPAPDPAKPARILLVDDNADMREYLCRLLSAHGEVEAVPDGVEALTAIDRQLPDLVLTDVMMPRLDGFALLRALRERPRGGAVPVIVLSARAGEEARIEGLRAGADDYLVKPFSARELVARVEANLKLSRIRREVEGQLRKSEQRARLAIVAARLGTWRYDLLSGSGEVDGWMREIWGIADAATITIEEALQSISIHPDDRVQVRDAIAAALDPAFMGRYEMEYRIVLPDRSERWVSVNGLALFEGEGSSRRAVEFFGTGLDITERKRAEAVLRESERRFRNMADNAPVMIWVVDASGDCIYLSRSWYDFTGQDEQAGLGLGWVDALHPEDRERAKQDFLIAAERGTTFRLEYRLRRKDGVYRWVIDSAAPRTGTDGRFEGYIGSVMDITERKHAEQLLEETRAEAEEANRAKDRFLAMLSHELRTPLNPIVGWTQLLRRGRLSPQAQADALEVIERNAKLQNQLIEDLLDVSRIEQGKFELRPLPLSPERVVHAAMETVRTFAQKADVKLEIQTAADLPTINADPTRLSQVVWNLLTNAVKFTPAGGRVEVRLERTTSGVRIEVSDSGMGIIPEFLPRLFERFSQASEGTTRTRGGLGLGLFIVRHIVEAHGGQVSVESEGEGKGATFTVELPVSGETSLSAGVTGEVNGVDEPG